MGYELHITRADDWTASEDSPISEAEWQAAVDADPRVEVFDGNSVPSWKSADGPSMSWSGGQVNVKGVQSEAEIGEIAGFAATLGARVQGDDGEIYEQR